MASSTPNRLTQLQQDLLAGFFARERRFFLTGGGALAGFYFGHRETEDLDLFSAPGPDLQEVAQTLTQTVQDLGASLETRSRYRDFHRYLVRRHDEECIVDLVIDRAPMVESEKAVFGEMRVDTLREIAANKVCTLIGRSEIKDLVDLHLLVGSGIDLEQAFTDAFKKEASAEPEILAWILDELRIAPESVLPGSTDPVALDAFRRDFAKQLRALAFRRARRRPSGED